MARRTVTRAQLSEAVFQEVGLSHDESAQIVNSLLDEIASCLVTGDEVKISSFGSFRVRHKGPRMGRNPKTGEEVPIEPRRALVFRPSHVLKDQVNSAHEPPNGSRPHMAVGKVKWFDATKGFGFIEPSDGSEYAFVDRYAIENSGLRALIDGQKVQYDIVPGIDGKAAAVNLVILD